jgi:uncharacterized protein YraI
MGVGMMKRWAGWAVAALLLGVLALSLTGAIAEPANDFGVGWSVQYFNNASLQGTPVATETLAAGINFNWGSSAPIANVPNTNWSARYSSVQSLTGGTYQFVVTSDDGVRVLIDGVNVLDRFIGRPLTTDTFTVNLTPGAHTFVVEYFQGIDQAALQFQWVLVSGGVTTATPIFVGPTPTLGPAPTATAIPPTSLPPIPPGALTGTVVRATTLLTRSGPFPGAPVVGRLQRGQTYAIIGRDQDANWYLLQLSGFQGWVWSYYIFVNGNAFNAPVTAPFVTAGASSDIVLQTTSTLRLRAAPTTDSAQTGRIPWGTLLPIIGRTADGGWYQTQFLGTIGWISAGYGNIIQGDPNAAPVTG